MQKWGYIAGLGLLLLVVAVMMAALWRVAEPPLAEAGSYPAGQILRDRSGRVLRVGLGPDDQDCRPYYRASYDDWVVQAVVASEDQRFMSHAGVDLVAIGRAVKQNMSAGRRLSGASTITMQSVRLIQPHPRTWFWKGVEAIQALRLERELDKYEILSQYLNRAPFGSNLVGVEAAAWGWFGKAPVELNLGEAALLAGLIQSPTRLRPDRHMERALKRRSYVLERMVQLGMISGEEQAAAAGATPVLQRAARPFEAPFFCDWVAGQPGGRGRGDITTTLDAGLQGVVERELRRVAGEHGVDCAVVVVEVKGCAVRALGCSGDYFSREGGQVNTVTTPRPAGSVLKPLVFAQAIERGILTPERVVADVPRRFGDLAPANFSGSFMGLVSAREALVLSLNLPAVELVQQVGLERFYAVLRELGFDALQRPAAHYGLGIVLGNGSIRLSELAAAYACLARGGEWQGLEGFEGGGGGGGGRGRRIFSEGSCWMVSDMLGGGERAQAAVGHLAEARVAQAAWKTGTSAGFRDAWTVLWNPEYVVAVWCGYKSGRRGGDSLVGIRVAAPLAWDMLRQLYPDGRGPWFRVPAEVEERELCVRSGMMRGPYCSELIRGHVLKQRSLFEVCSVHVVDSESGQVVERWPSEVRSYLAVGGGGGSESRGELIIATPADRARFRVVEQMEGQEIVFRTSGGVPGELLYWFRNDVLEGTSRNGESFVWQPEVGSQRFTCANGAGVTATVEIEVQGL